MFYYEDLILSRKGKKNWIPLDELNTVAYPQIITDEIFIHHDQLDGEWTVRQRRILMHYGINTMFYYEDLILSRKGKKNWIPLDELNTVAFPQIITDEIFFNHHHLDG